MNKCVGRSLRLVCSQLPFIAGLLLVNLSLLCAPAFGAATSETVARKNVLFIVVDDLNVALDFATLTY